MTEELTPRELANAKKQARAVRIRNIRRQVAVTAATLAAVFSGVVLARTQLNQPVNPQPTQVAMVGTPSGDGDSEGPGTTGTIINAALGAAGALATDDDGDGEPSDDDETGVAETVLKAATGAADAVIGSGSSTGQSSSSSSPSVNVPLVTSQS
jgi:hypothetical protein